MPSESCESSLCGSPLSPKGFGFPHNRPWTYDPYSYASQKELSMEEREEEDAEKEENEKEMSLEQLSDVEVCEAFDSVLLFLFLTCDVLTNLLFSQDDIQSGFQSRYSSHWRRPTFSPRWAYMPRDRRFGFCRSLSSSMENMAFSGAPLSPKKDSFSSLDEPVNEDCLYNRRAFRDDTSLHCSRRQGIFITLSSAANFLVSSCFFFFCTKHQSQFLVAV